MKKIYSICKAFPLNQWYDYWVCISPFELSCNSLTHGRSILSAAKASLASRHSPPANSARQKHMSKEIIW